MLGKLSTLAISGILLLALLQTAGCEPEEGPASFLGKRETWDYGPAMKEVAQKFSGVEGVVLHLGDSITYASPYTAWARGGEGKTPEDEAVLRWSHCGEQNDLDGYHLASYDVVYNDRSYTAASGVRADQYMKGGHRGLPPLEEIVTKYNPQIAIVMLGSNDVHAKRSVSSARSLRSTSTMRARSSTIPRSGAWRSGTSCPSSISMGRSWRAGRGRAGTGRCSTRATSTPRPPARGSPRPPSLPRRICGRAGISCADGCRSRS